jgi:hypothetical protein
MNENLLSKYPILKEFQDMFPKEIWGLSSRLDINLTIDLVPKVAPLSKAPYKMCSQELTEIKMHLQERLDK